MRHNYQLTPIFYWTFASLNASNKLSCKRVPYATLNYSSKINIPLTHNASIETTPPSPGADPGALLPAGDADKQLGLPARHPGVAVGRRDPAALGLLRRGVRADQPHGAGVGIRQLSAAPVDRPYLWI